MGSRAPQRWDVRSLLAWMTEDFKKRGIESARLDAELLAAHALGCDRIALYMDLDRPLVDLELGALRALTARRRKYEPIAYIVGKREFYAHEFVVTKDVLVPRPDTETLVEAVLERMGEGERGPLLDLCAGSGAVGISVALARPSLEVMLSDVSEAAIEVASGNANRLGVSDRVGCAVADLLSPSLEPARFRFVTCNPPYVAREDYASLSPDIREHEPSLALLAGEDGLDVYRRLAADGKGALSAGTQLFVEVGAGQADAVKGLFSEAGFEVAGVHRDLSGIDRVVAVSIPHAHSVPGQY